MMVQKQRFLWMYGHLQNKNEICGVCHPKFDCMMQFYPDI